MNLKENSIRIGYVALLLLSLLLLVPTPTATLQGQGGLPAATQFERMVDDGFGDVTNSTAWSMLWWNDALYLGTARAMTCWTVLAIHLIFPTIPYPPEDPDLVCLDPITEMDLSAELWRWDVTGGWQQIYKAPTVVPVPGSSSLTGRDVGYREIALFQENDGEVAAYISTTYPKAVNPDAYPPPRILRSTDGTNWDALPQAAGTILGDYDQASFRAILDFDDRFFIVAAKIEGGGPLWEASDPEQGNNAFTVVTPDGLDLYSLADYNNQLYVGTSNTINPGDAKAPNPAGYEVLRTDATGSPPYTFESVVPPGAYSTANPPPRVAVSMAQYDGRLYTGSNLPVELIRVNPDNSWDLIVGDPRTGPNGLIAPLSGYGSGFDWEYTIHIWRMIEHDGLLFIGTADSSTEVRFDPALIGLEAFIGGDLYVSDDGITLYPITLNGFDDQFNMGFRTLQNTPYGLFIGTHNPWQGAEVWRLPALSERIYLPLVARSGGGEQVPPSATGHHAVHPLLADRATRLMVEPTVRGNLISWEPPYAGARVALYRIDLGPDGATERELARTTDAYFLDESALANQSYRYYAVAERADGSPAGASNLVTLPLSQSPITPERLEAFIAQWSSEAAAHNLLFELRQQSQNADLEGVRTAFEQIERSYHQMPDLPTWRQADVQYLLDLFARRLGLAEQNMLDVEQLSTASPNRTTR
ncbi:MAG: hypothetical protein KDD73_09155 [Anaerolineales bacterium]|nr:hypothetical protein [Anaerolineales bacterium]